MERDGHRVAWNAALAAHGLDIEWGVDEYRRLIGIPDERRRIAAGLHRHGGCSRVSTDVLVDQIYSTKMRIFEELILDADLAPRPGLIDLVTDAFVAGVWVAVVTGGRRSWAEPLVRQLVGEGLVETVVTADDVVEPVPGPEAYELALWEFGISAENVLAVTGSVPALQAATSVGLATVVIAADRDSTQDYNAAAAVRADYAGADPMLIAKCERLHGRWWAAETRSVAA